MTERADWAEYRRWNDAIAEQFFSGRYGGRPVYLDLEDDVCHQVALRAEYEGTDPRRAVFDATTPTLTVAIEGEGTFSGHIERLRIWRINGRGGWPPFVGALALLSLVAEEMAVSEDFSSRNYYGRLLRWLGEEPNDARLRHKLVRDFGRQSHELWEALNDWLLDDPELRGYPTAYSFDYRAHIGRPISQALLREADRAALLDLFAEWRLEPGNSIAPGVMRDLLGDAVEHGGFSGTLRRIAQQPDALERLAEVACAELSAWKGATAGAPAGTSGISLIGARRSRPFPSLVLTPVVFDEGLAGAAEVSFLDQNGEPTRQVRGFVKDADEFGTRPISAGLSSADLLAATVVVSTEARRATRSPRVLVLLENRPERGRLEEVGRAQLGAEYVLLVREGQVSGVRSMLETAGRPGWEMRTPEQLRGVPDGWRAFTDVQLLAIPTTQRPDLAPLVPVGWTRLSVNDGMLLPGRHAFLRSHPPELAASVVEARSVRAVLTRDDSDLMTELGEVEHAAAWDLGAYGLPSGAHRVTLLVEPDGQSPGSEGDENAKVIDSARIALYDPDKPLEREIDSAYGHRLVEPLAVISAVRADGVDCRGALVPALDGDAESSESQLAEALDDIASARDAEEAENGIAVAERVSDGVHAVTCIQTGAHLMREVEGAQGRGGEAPWRCAYCGLEKYFPTSLWRVRRRGRNDGSVLAQAALELPALRDRDVVQGHAELIEAVCTVRAGSWGDFSRLVSQLDDRPWATREKGRLYSALGLIDVECSQSSLEPTAWQVCPPVLVKASERAAFLVGWRSPRMVDELKLLAETDGGSASVVTGPEGLPIVRVEDLDDEALALIATMLEAADEWGGAGYEREPGLALAARLPSLSTVRSCLHPGSLPDRGLERYDPESARWVLHGSGRSGGAFRSQRRGWRWWHVNGDGDVRIVDSRLSKWLAAHDRRRPMLAYRHADRILLAHVACPLPGLYERAAVLCSGLPPIELEGHLLGYRDVPEKVASLLAAALEG